MHENKKIAIDFLNLIVVGKASQAFDQYTDSKFIHHNPYFEGDAQSLMHAMQEDARQNPDKSFQVLRSVGEDDLVVIHSLIRQNEQDKGSVLIHIFKFHHQKILELWDVGQAVPDEMINENGML